MLPAACLSDCRSHHQGLSHCRECRGLCEVSRGALPRLCRLIPVGVARRRAHLVEAGAARACSPLHRSRAQLIRFLERYGLYSPIGIWELP